jgi:hypothetical protein
MANTRGVTNDELGREWCATIAGKLKGPRGDAKSDAVFEAAVRIVIGWLEKIADGADPAEVLFKGKPSGNERSGALIVFLVETNVAQGMGLNDACRAVAREPIGQGTKWQSIKSRYLRHRGKIEGLTSR